MFFLMSSDGPYLLSVILEPVCASLILAVGQVNTALQLDAEEFKEKYGGEMPRETDEVVFSCLAGIRSKNAQEMAISLGYKG